MNIVKKSPIRLVRPADALLPVSLLASALFCRESVALYLFIALYGSRLCALSSASGLRGVFARQPAMRYVQGSALLSLLLQPIGGALAALLMRGWLHFHIPYTLIICGTLLNIEHVFYEYLYATGDERSATLCRFLTALMILAGTLLCALPSAKLAFPKSYEAKYLLTASGLSALIALVIGFFMGGKFKPRWNAEIVRLAPLSMLQTALYPALALAAMLLLRVYIYSSIPLFSGLIVYELCRSPFRRTPIESGPMNQALLLCCVAASLCAVLYYFFFKRTFSPMLPVICGTVILAALCAFSLYGNFSRREADAS